MFLFQNQVVYFLQQLLHNQMVLQQEIPVVAVPDAVECLQELLGHEDQQMLVLSVHQMLTDPTTLDSALGGSEFRSE